MTIINIFKFFIFALLTSTQALSAQNGKYFDRAIFVLFENKNYIDVLKQPFFSQLAQTGAHFTNFVSLTHPSQANYIALTSGSLHNVKGDGTIDLNVTNIVDLLEAKGLTWKVYAEDYPGLCFTGTRSASYVRKHNPFISYLNIQKNSARCANIVNAQQFDEDAANNSLSNYVFYIPNNKNNSHDTNLAYADKWYEQRFSKYVNNSQFMQNTVLISAFDESNLLATKNQIYTNLNGPHIKPGTYSKPLTLYSLLSLIEENWDLGNLGQEDATAPSFPNIWQ